MDFEDDGRDTGRLCEINDPEAEPGWFLAVMPQSAFPRGDFRLVCMTESRTPS